MNFILNYDIQDPQERIAFIKDLLEHTLIQPTPSDLERMGDYIICGRGKEPNPIERGEVLAPKSKYNTYVLSESRNVSLDALVDNSMPFDTQYHSWNTHARKRNPIKRPHRLPNGQTDPGDSNIPGMPELWKQIDTIEKNLKKETDTYKQYKMRHHLIELQRQQYELRDCYRPPMNPSATATSTPHFARHVDFSADSGYWLTEQEWRDKLAASYNPRLSRNIDDYETKVTPKGVFVKWIVRRQQFDWEDPAHVRALMEHYDLLVVQDGEHPDTQGYALLQDFQLYRQKAQITPLRDYILERRLAHASYGEIRAEVEEKWGIRYNNSYLCRVLTQELPRTIAQTATRHRLLNTTPDSQRKVCPKCERALPCHPIFFGLRRDESDGFSRWCRDCTRLSLNKDQIDKRFKDSTRGEKNG